VELFDVTGPSTPSNSFISTPPVYHLSYASALALWQNEDILTLKQLFKLPDTFISDKVDVVLAGTGIYF
jgi:hypothetical protein